ncbi:lipid kinase [Rhizobium halophilum]|uniref:lipid kinase n=1 Tax=Rhizobium halophilum TaxID=2846852 RepID=UPI001EFDF529|nr:lipid kinase [Rhizobium halophilum]MCF6369955.1 lipid kinase [Rhizobium halophilum]
MTAKPALLLVNPRSRRGNESLPEVRRLLQLSGLSFVELPPGYGGTTSHAIEEYAASIDSVIVGGGDGSLNNAAPGLLKTDLPLGVLPLGTANDFARTIALPQDLAGAVEVIARGNTRKIDLGEANGHPFFNVASVGFSVDLARSLTEKAKKRWGKLGYGVVAARLLAGSRLFTATLEHDGEVEELRTMQVAVGNGRFYGGGMTVHADATATDGMLDFYSLEVDHWWRLLALLPSLRKGTHGDWRDVRVFSTKGLTLRTSRPQPVNLDGEIKTETPVTFGIREEAISVFTP